MRCLITGDCGFIGRHFRDHLESIGYLVQGCDIAHPTDPIDCRYFFETDRTRFDLVVHCAAVIPDIDSRWARPFPMAANIEMDSAYLQWCLRTSPTKAVYFSSSAAYPVALNIPGHALHESDIDLDDLRQPDGIYGFAKLVGEVQARMAISEGLDLLVVRPQSGYGSDQSLNYPFPSFAARAARRDDPFEIWGDGTVVRDWIHVDDIVGAIMTAIRLGIDGPINLGWGEPVSFGELAMMFFECAGYVPSVALLTDKPGGAPYRYADPSKMLSFYAPRVTLEEGIARALEHAGLPAAV